MNISLNWLKDFINIPDKVSPEKLGELLTMHAVEVEGVINLAKSFDNIVVGKITKISKHPNADKLQLTKVSDGDKEYDIVCGGSNLSVGMLVVLAKVGAMVKWHGQGELVEMKPAEIRGEKSEGMICASEEIGLTSMFPMMAKDEVVDLGSDYKVGDNLAKALEVDDVIYDIDNKSITNRPDLWGHYGMARDIATWLDIDLKKYSDSKIKLSDKQDIKVDVQSVKVCPRYMVVAIDNIEIASSPEWMQTRLLACGMRPINNIVDITNYVMLELGQPTHAFDLEKLGDNIVVRPAKSGEIIVTLDNEERKLDQNDLVIANDSQPVAIAGVMGSNNAEIDNSTKAIVIESANFSSVEIRQTSQKLNLRTESSQRFEKSLDPEMCEIALQRIVALVKEIVPKAEVSSPVVDEYNTKPEKNIIKVEADWIEQKIGIEISSAEIVYILKKLGFEVSGTKTLSVIVPSWRNTKDIEVAEDLVEEVARVHGYSNIKPVPPLASMAAPAVNKKQIFISKLRDILSYELHLTEVYNYSFVNEKLLKKFDIDSSDYIALANPLTKDYTLLRQSLAQYLLANVITNQRNTSDIGMYEIGNIFLPEAGDLDTGIGSDKLPNQPTKLGVVKASAKGDIFDIFLDIKGVLEFIASSLGIEFSFLKNHKDVVEIKIADTFIGNITSYDKTEHRKMGLKSNSVLVELDIDLMLASLAKVDIKQYQEKNKFPFLIRDLAFVVDQKIMYNDIKEVILSSGDLIRNIELFDVYMGEKVGAGKKNMAFHVTFGSLAKTLTGDEVGEVEKTIASNLKKKFNAQLRDF